MNWNEAVKELIAGERGRSWAVVRTESTSSMPLAR